MPYLKILEALLGALSGAQAAVLLDSQGELVVEAGDRDPRHRLIGAYQGIALARLRRLATDYGVGEVSVLSCRYASGQVVLSPLKDGYYLVVSLTRDANLPLSVALASQAAVEVNKEL